MDQNSPSTPSSMYGGRDKLSPVSNSSFRSFARNLLGAHQKSAGGGSSTVASFGSLPAPIALVPAAVGTIVGMADVNPSMDKKSRVLDDKFARFVSVEETKFDLMDEAGKRLILEVGSLRDEREKFAIRKQNEVVQLADVLTERVGALVRARQEEEVRHEDRVFADLIALETEVRKLKVKREESQGAYAKKIGDNVSKVQSELDKCRQLRTEQGERIASIIHDELVGVQQELAQVKAERLESENETMKMVEELCFKIRAEIDNERQLRQFGEEQLLQLLEETCNRVEANFQLAAGAPRQQRPTAI